MDIGSWFQLVVICFLGAISPGPSLALVAGNTIVGGRTYGIATSLGHAAGIGLWAFLTAMGIAEVLVDQSSILLALRTSGAFLIAYIGFRTIMVGDGLPVQQKDERSIGSTLLLRGTGEGFLISLLNPKVALFFLAIFSHLVDSDSSWLETGLMGIAAAAIDACWYVSVALMLAGTGLMNALRSSETAIRRISGGLLILIALYFFAVTIRGLLL